MPVPRELWAEVVGWADADLTEAINVFWEAAEFFVPALAIICNAPVGSMTVELAIDGSPETEEHEYFQNFLPAELGRPRHTRAFPMERGRQFLAALSGSSEQARLLRACAFYREALRFLRPGEELQNVVYLWMAVEALTKVALRRECEASNCSADDLVKNWSLAGPDATPDQLRAAKRGLDGEVRRRLIFHGATDSYKAACDASNGFEHGFEEFHRLRQLAVQSRRSESMEHVRRAIVELVGLDSAGVGALTAEQYLHPRANWPITKYMRGVFVGPADALAAPDKQYPFLVWKGTLKGFAATPTGGYEATFDETMTVSAGEGVQFRPTSFEVYGPQNDPLGQ
jgi:hypothetical protein